MSKGDTGKEMEMPSAETRGGGAEGRFRRAPRRVYYSIGEVCGLLGMKAHVLRYWETRFEELSPAKNRAGNRVYQPEEIELIALIHRLVHEDGYTVDGARRRLAELREAGAAASESSRALQRAYLRALRAELEALHELLGPAGR